MNKFVDKIFDWLRHSWLAGQMRSLTSDGSGRPVAIFRSARIKLTVFYFAVIVVFAVVLTLSVLELAQNDFNRAGLAQRGSVRHLFSRFYSVPPPDDFYQVQNQSRQNVRHQLDEDVVIVDIIAIAVGGLLSYWFAGRTLRPIEQANKAQARFAADASHELRTPLAAMQIENEIFLRQKSFTNSQARNLIGSNLEEVQRLENLATTLLALTSYEQAEFELRAVGIKEVIASALRPLAKNAKAKNIRFIKEFDSQMVMGNFDSLVQLAGIILDNAIKYGPAGSAIFIDGARDGDMYHLSIRDQGPGIEAEDLPYIFDRLYRGDKARGSAATGYGLGLSLAREIARANHGQIIARNYAEGGAQLSVVLPVAKA